MLHPTAELEASFRKSSYSGGNRNDCVEVADAPAQDMHLVRDTQNRELGALGFSTGAWAQFLVSARK